MNKINNTNTSGGFPLYDDDIRFIQDYLIEDLEKKLSSIGGNCIFSGGGYTVSGATFTAYSGVYSYGAKLYETSNYLSGYTGDINNVWVVSDTTYDSSGDRTFKDGTIVTDIYEINKCKYVYDTGTPSGYDWQIKLVDLKPLSYWFAKNINYAGYSEYEVYKTWIDNLFDSDTKSAYTFDKLLENDTRVQYNIDKLLLNQTLREYFMDKLITNNSDRDYLINKIKDGLIEEFTSFTFVNSYSTAAAHGNLLLTKDINGYVNIFGTFKANGSDNSLFINSLPADYIPSTIAGGIATEISTTSSAGSWLINVSTSGNISFYSSPSGNTTTSYVLDIKYKV